MQRNGFTLIELMVVLVLLSVLVVTIAPNINNTSDYTYATQRDQILSLLRNVQQRAMQNTQLDALERETCHFVNLHTDKIGLSEINDNGAGTVTCNLASMAVAVGDTDDFLIIEVDSPYTALNDSGESVSQIGFNYLGQPYYLDSGNKIQSSFVISLSNKHQVCIESQGYIHDCN